MIFNFLACITSTKPLRPINATGSPCSLVCMYSYVHLVDHLDHLERELEREHTESTTYTSTQTQGDGSTALLREQTAHASGPAPQHALVQDRRARDLRWVLSI